MSRYVECPECNGTSEVLQEIHNGSMHDINISDNKKPTKTNRQRCQNCIKSAVKGKVKMDVECLRCHGSGFETVQTRALYKTCPNCKGKGEKDIWITCKNCGGAGTIATQIIGKLHRSKAYTNNTVPCPVCARSLGGRKGKIKSTEVCQRCDGRGKVKGGSENVVVKSPEEIAEQKKMSRQKEEKTKQMQVESREKQDRLQELTIQIDELTAKLEKMRRMAKSTPKNMDERIELSQKVQSLIEEYDEIAKSMGFPKYQKKSNSKQHRQ